MLLCSDHWTESYYFQVREYAIYFSSEKPEEIATGHTRSHMKSIIIKTNEIDISKQYHTSILGYKRNLSLEAQRSDPLRNREFCKYDFTPTYTLTNRSVN